VHEDEVRRKNDDRQNEVRHDLTRMPRKRGAYGQDHHDDGEFQCAERAQFDPQEREESGRCEHGLHNRREPKRKRATERHPFDEIRIENAPMGEERVTDAKQILACVRREESKAREDCRPK
jgi:hypothetical protein